MRQQKAISVDPKTNNRLEAEEALLAMAENVAEIQRDRALQPRHLEP
jgi:hypothetical protein